MFTNFLADFRYGIRSIRRDPLFAAMAVLSLSIGIGADTTVFTAGNALLLQTPSGVIEPNRLVDISSTDDALFGVNQISFPNYTDIRRRATALEDMYGYDPVSQPMSISAGGGAERIYGHKVTWNYFNVLGVRPYVGRLFDSSDDTHAVVLSHRFWTRRFHQDPSMLSRTVTLNAQQVTVTQAAADLDTIGRQLAQENPQQNAGKGLRLAGASFIPGNLAIPLAGIGLSMMFVSLVLVIARTNVAGLLLARVVARRREIAVRLAIGAGRSRLIGQMVAEALCKEPAPLHSSLRESFFLTRERTLRRKTAAPLIAVLLQLRITKQERSSPCTPTRSTSVRGIPLQVRDVEFGVHLFVAGNLVLERQSSAGTARAVPACAFQKNFGSLTEGFSASSKIRFIDQRSRLEHVSGPLRRQC